MTTAMNNSPLGRLPQELRDRIYALALTNDGPLSFRFHDLGTEIVKDESFSTTLIALPSTCKQARAESMPFINTENSLSFNLSREPTDEEDPAINNSLGFLIRFIKRMGPADSYKTIKRIHVKTGTWYLDCLDTYAIEGLWYILSNHTTGFNKGVVITAEMNFDWMGFMPMDGLEKDGPLVVNVTAVIKDKKASLENAKKAVEGLVASFVQMLPKGTADDYPEVMAIFKEFSGEVEKAMTVMADVKAGYTVSL